MIKLEEMYHKVKSVGMDKPFLKKMLEIYIKNMPISANQFYSGVVNEGNHQQDTIKPEEEKKFYIDLLKEWKTAILNLDDKVVNYPIDTDYTSEQLSKLKEHLLKFEIGKDALEEIKKDTFLYHAFFEDLLGVIHSKWCHLERHKLKVQSTLLPKIHHRLYLNCLSSDILFIVKRFCEACEEKDLPYNLKFDISNDTRDDKIIIYTNTIHLMSYVEILKEFERSYPEIMKHALSTPLLVGNIDAWIGYGDEPEYESESYNDLRTKIIYQVITHYVLNKVLDYEVEQQKIAYYFIEVKKIVPVTENKELIYQNLIEKICIEINKYLKDTSYISPSLKEILQYIPILLTEEIIKQDSNLDEMVEEMKEYMNRYNIDTKRICFNSDTLDKFKMYDRKGNMSEIDFLKTLQISMKPNYFKIGDGIYQSIQNILYIKFTKLIQTTGEIYTKGGILKNAKYFLEEIVQNEFSKDKIIYADIYKKYICGNAGKVTIRNNEEIATWEVTEFLGDTLLRKQIQFQSKKETVRDCMKQLEVYLPASGIIYTNYGRRMRLLDFLRESFQNKTNFKYYKDIVDWFYDHMGNNPGIFSSYGEQWQETNEEELVKEVQFETMIL